MQPEKSDSNIIHDILAGNTEAYTILINKYGAQLYTLCYRLTGNAADAKDLTQTVLVKAFENLQDFHQESIFSTWIHTIAVNAWINISKHKKIVHYESIDKDIETGEGQRAYDVRDLSDLNFEAVIQKNRNKMLMQECLLKLDYHHQVILVLRFVENKTYEEIAAICDCALGTVASRLSRALQALKTVIDPIREEFDEV